MTKPNIESQLSQEISALQRQDGSWAPEDVIEFAKTNKESACHTRFNWNKSEAAMEHWLLTARHLIKQYVVVVERRSGSISIVGHVYSVPSRRGSDDGSYVSETTLSANQAWREEILAEVVSKLQTMKSRYESVLPELKAVWKAIK